MNIQWYPGHMTKTRRMLETELGSVDAVCEIVDARIPLASRNPDLDALASRLPRLLVLNRCDQADPAANARWRAYFTGQGYSVLETDSKSGTGIRAFVPAVRELLAAKIKKEEARGITATLRLMVVGVPNVGKSSFINRITGRRAAKAEDRPGVTRGKQWFTLPDNIQLLDTPGMLWPKFEDERVGQLLAFTGAVRDEILDLETLACKLVDILSRVAPDAIETRYGVKPLAGPWETVEACARKRGFLISGGEADTVRMARILLDEFRGGKLGRITLELPEEYNGPVGV